MSSQEVKPTHIFWLSQSPSQPTDPRVSKGWLGSAPVVRAAKLCNELQVCNFSVIADPNTHTQKVTLGIQGVNYISENTVICVAIVRYNIYNNWY